MFFNTTLLATIFMHWDPLLVMHKQLHSWYVVSSNNYHHSTVVTVEAGALSRPLRNRAEAIRYFDLRSTSHVNHVLFKLPICECLHVNVLR